MGSIGKFEFRLAGILDLREKLERQKELEYGEAMSQLEKERETLKRLQSERQQLLIDKREMVSSLITPLEVERQNNYIIRADKLLVKQEKVIKEAEAVVEEKRAALVIAMQERKTMEKLEERELEEWKEEEKRAEQRMVDEVVSFRFNQ